LWMALVIAFVRFVAYLITKTVYRNATQGEISSLVRTVLSVIIYIVAFFIIFQSQFPNVQLAPLFTGSTIIGIVVGTYSSIFVAAPLVVEWQKRIAEREAAKAARNAA